MWLVKKGTFVCTQYTAVSTPHILPGTPPPPQSPAPARITKFRRIPTATTPPPRTIHAGSPSPRPLYAGSPPPCYYYFILFFMETLFRISRRTKGGVKLSEQLSGS